MLKTIPPFITALVLGCAPFSMALAGESTAAPVQEAPQAQEARSTQKAVPERLTRRLESMQKRLSKRQAMLNKALAAPDLETLKRLHEARRGQRAEGQGQRADKSQRSRRGQRMAGKGQHAQERQRATRGESSSKRMKRARAQYSRRHAVERSDGPSVRQGLKNMKAHRDLRGQHRGERMQRVREFIGKARQSRKAGKHQGRRTHRRGQAENQNRNF